MESLRRAVNPRHLNADAIARGRAAIEADRFDTVVVDDFLQPALAAGLLACFERDGIFREHRSLKRGAANDGGRADDPPPMIEQTVSAEQFDAAARGQWLARELLMASEPPADTATRGWQAHMQLMRMLGSAAFEEYLGALTGATGLREVTYMARTMRHGDVCTAHSDAGDGRSLCMLLYIGDGWRAGHGGRFQNVVDGRVARDTDPRGNRLILHRPAPDQIHQVEPISDAGRLWRRHSYSVWFGTFPDRP